MISQLPTDIASDDTWISLEAIRLHGLSAIELLNGPFVYYKPPTSWEDFIKQESRFVSGTNQLFRKYHELKKIDEDRVEKRKVTQEKLISLLKADLGKKNNIPANILYEIKDVLMRAIRENETMNEAKLVTETGNWEPIESTK